MLLILQGLVVEDGGIIVQWCSIRTRLQKELGIYQAFPHVNTLLSMPGYKSGMQTSIVLVDNNPHPTLKNDAHEWNKNSLNH